MPGLEIESGIEKAIRSGPVRVTRLGLEDDEHDPIFHGGVDKALHGYCCSHYPNWRAEYPAAADRLRWGSFGENFVMRHMNERNVCIGDVFSVGDEVLVQVSLPRQPCFKLNHRFHIKNFAPQTYRTSRTGWYYRVLREGTVQAGDAVTLVERRWPKWTIERVQEYLHRNQDDLAMNEELAAIEAMGEESRGAFRTRAAKAKAKAKAKANANADKGPKEKWRDFRIIDRKIQTPRIASYILEAVAPDSEAEPFPRGGTHVRLRLPNGLQRSYSIVSGDPNKFELAVALEPASRGGSRWLHSQDAAPEAGAVIQVGRMTTDVPNASAASHLVFVAGGVGITAFLALIENNISIHLSLELHYAVRSAEDVPFRDRVFALGSALHLYDGAKGERMDIDQIVGALKWNSQLYLCGPSRMMAAAREAVGKHGVDEKEVHFEAFEAEMGGDPFEAEVANRDGRVVRVGEEETLLEALKREFGSDAMDSSCEVGNCGTCAIGVRSGRVDHRGTALSKEEKGDAMLSCVSRGVGRITIEI
ncbi:MOSC domain-containing protein [Sodiomyces alkalinus F11]|uniref:MOSC domain-containing protein n=1 Tax=Sodiomyces alkalinus (strain CBS 110278 / VKM F-3762 / F11) TaxID=1314773 RepID=A0A3N2PTT9_SODAK|nr:MOSC domain-containing protein [Sodiomyces alkalinus F11]ROT37746.1 MOSC domain-containing protein [Sodiomyces alkalinus F11]